MDTGKDCERPRSQDGSPRVSAPYWCRGREDSQDRAVTPIVANLLMVAVVLVVAMLVLVLALGIFDSGGEELPVASFDVDRGPDGQLSIAHVSGKPIETARLSISFGERTYPMTSYISADQINSGTVVGPIYPNQAEEVKLLWKTRESSQVLYTVTVSNGGSIPQYLRFEDTSIGSYDAGQDRDGAYQYSTGTRTLTLQNNAWKVVPYETRLTESSVLEFDFKSTDEGEIHGIGLEDDTNPSSDRIFKLFGTQNDWASQYESYETSDGWVNYQIPVGELYTASQRQDIEFLALVNDLDDGSATSDSWFRNIRVYNVGATLLDVTIDGTTDGLPVEPYGSQDEDGAYELDDGNETLQLTNNTWKYVPVDFTATDQTTVSFEFNSTSEGEIHAIGFETDGTETASQFVTLDGTQSWGVDYGSYETGDGWVQYDINIDDQTGLSGTDISRLVFVNDDDSPDPSGVSLFRNVTVSKTG